MVEGNSIGFGFDGEALGNALNGVFIDSGATGTTIGGTVADSENTIVHNGQAGVFVGAGTGNRISGNSISDNAGLGIDLAPAGVTPNDPSDADTGANNLQNFPEITSARATGDRLVVQGALHSAPNGNYHLEFFYNPSADPSGYGQGEFSLGALDVTTDASGTANFTFSGTDSGGVITATATDDGGNTSEFSQAVPVVAVPVAHFLAVGTDAGTVPTARVLGAQTQAEVFRVQPYGSDFTGGVRVAVGDVNDDGTPDLITGIGPGGGPHVEVFDGVTHQVIRSFYAYDSIFAGGVFVAAGDVNGDGFADIVTGIGEGGGPNVRVFSGKDGTVLKSFYAYDPSFAGGVRVAVVTDLAKFGEAAIVTAPGPGGGPNVRLFDTSGAMLASFYGFDPAFSGGVYVAGG